MRHGRSVTCLKLHRTNSGSRDWSTDSEFPSWPFGGETTQQVVGGSEAFWKDLRLTLATSCQALCPTVAQALQGRREDGQGAEPEGRL